MKWRPWKYLHLFAYVIVSLMFIHVLQIGTFFYDYVWIRAVWYIFFSIYIIALLHRLLAFSGVTKKKGEVLRYRARATRGGVRVGLVSVPIGSALASLDGTDNLFVFSTARYRDRPLVVSGPGAGVEVTAAGVLGDVLRLTAK